MSAAIKPMSVSGAVATGSSTQLKTENSELKTVLPNSRRIYIDGQQAGVRVPFREIDQNPTRNFKNELEENAAVRVYETAGPYGDPSVHTDVREGLAQLRREWIVNRGDVEEYEGRSIQPIDDGYLTFDAAQTARDKGRLEDFPTLRRTPLRAKKGSCVTQMHYAKRGIVTPEMEFIALRENLGRSLECADSSALSKAATSRRTPNKQNILLARAGMLVGRCPSTGLMLPFTAWARAAFIWLRRLPFTCLFLFLNTA